MLHGVVMIEHFVKHARDHHAHARTLCPGPFRRRRLQPSLPTWRHLPLPWQPCI
jgi:hypothetical protein